MKKVIMIFALTMVILSRLIPATHHRSENYKRPYTSSNTALTHPHLTANHTETDNQKMEHSQPEHQ